MKKSVDNLKNKKLQNAVFCMTMALSALVSQHAYADDKEKHCVFYNRDTLPITFSGFQPTIKGLVNGKPINMIVDTGAYKTGLFRSTAEKLELPLSHNGTTSFGIGGESANYNAFVKEWAIGPFKAQKDKLRVIWDAAVDNRESGLLGADILFQRDIELSLAEQYIKFFYPLGCDDTFLAYWDPNANVVDMYSHSTEDPRQVVPVLLNGKKIRALIDTGAARSVLDIKAAAKLGITPESSHVTKGEKNIGIGKAKVDSWVAPFESFSIGDETVKNLKLQVINIWGAATKDARSVQLTGDLERDEPEMILGIDFLRAHRLLFSPSQHSLYFSYLGGTIFYTTDEQDTAWYKKAAELGNPDAQYQLGRLYSEGKGVPKDDAKALEWVRKSAEKDYIPAQVQLGWMYETGEGVAMDGEQAVKWYSKAANQDDPTAQIYLGGMYESGQGVPKDRDQARAWYRKATDQKFGPAFFKLGRSFFFSNELAESAKNLELAAEKMPNYHYVPLWQFLVKSRTDKAGSADKELERMSDAVKERKWPMPIVDFYLGHLASDGLVATAGDEDEKKAKDHLCEANFYIAEKYLLQDKKKEAKPLLESARRDCPRNFFEYEGAVAELERLKEK